VTSQHRTPQPSDTAMEVTNCMTMKCASSDTEPLALIWQQHSTVSYMLRELLIEV